MSSGEPIFIEDGAAEQFMVWPDGTALRLEPYDPEDLDFAIRKGKGTASDLEEIQPHADGRVELLRLVTCPDCEDGIAHYERMDAAGQKWGVTSCEECGGYGRVLDYARELVSLREFVSAGEAA